MATEKTTFQVAFVGEFRVNQTNNLPKPLNRHTVNFFWAIPGCLGLAKSLGDFRYDSTRKLYVDSPSRFITALLKPHV